MNGQLKVIRSFSAATYFAGTEVGFAVANQAANDVHALSAAMARKRVELNAIYGGALFAQIFLDHPWLGEFTVDLRSSTEYNDAGGYFFTASSSVDDVMAVPGMTVPKDLQTEGGAFDPEKAADILSEKFRDWECDMYDALVEDRESLDDVTVTVSRDAIAHLLALRPVDGREAFVALFPQFASRVTDASNPANAGWRFWWRQAKVYARQKLRLAHNVWATRVQGEAR